MNNSNNEITLEKAVNFVNIDEAILKRRENNFLLSDFQISILRRNGIDYLKYSKIKDMLFDIEEILNDEFDEELDIVSAQLAEFIYYNKTNK